MSTESNDLRKRLAAAFIAGAKWCAKNGADHWCLLEQDADLYADNGTEKDHGGFVVYVIKSHGSADE